MTQNQNDKCMNSMIVIHNAEPSTGFIVESLVPKELLDEYKAAEAFADINPELLKAWEKIVKNAVFQSYGLPFLFVLTPERFDAEIMPMYNRAGKSVLLPLIKKYEAEALAIRQADDDYRRVLITGAWYDEVADIVETLKPKPKNKPWYGKFNKGKYQK